MKVVAALVQIETECLYCKGPMTRLGTAVVNADGTLGEVRPIEDEHRVCNKCTSARMRVRDKKNRQQQQWAAGTPSPKMRGGTA